MDFNSAGAKLLKRWSHSHGGKGGSDLNIVACSPESNGRAEPSESGTHYAYLQAFFTRSRLHDDVRTEVVKKRTA
jgi:hypothetical protein